jgi:hypothetical protein
MNKNKIPTAQEVAEFLRNAAYSDGQRHGLSWHMSIIHPRLSDGSIGFSGGIWKRTNGTDKLKTPNTSISFSFNETQGITLFELYRDKGKIQIGETPTFEEFKKRIIKEFRIDELYSREAAIKYRKP